MRHFATSVIAIAFAGNIFVPCAVADNTENQPLISQQSTSILTPHHSSSLIDSVESADFALNEAAKERMEVNARFALQERECYQKFFTNACIEQARENRRRSLATLRAIEIEANEFKRKARVAERDQLLKDKLKKDHGENNPHNYLTTYGTAMQEPVAQISDSAQHRLANHMNGVSVSSEHARHEVQLSKTTVKSRLDAKQRADNRAAFEKKVRESQQRQKEIATRKAGKSTNSVTGRSAELEN